MNPPHHPTPQQWQAAGSHFDLGAHRVFFREQARDGAPVLLLIHGYPTSSWDWAPIWPLLQAGHHLLAPDLLGFGYTSKPQGHRYRIAEQADLCDALLAHRGVREFHILAHDYGDTVAQELLARAIEPGAARPTLRSVCFLNGGLFPETHRARLVQKLLASPIGPWLAQRISKAKFTRTMHDIFGPDTPPGPEHIDGFWELATRDHGRAAMARLIGYMAERREHRARWVGALERAVLPMKLIDGGADPVSGAHMAERYRQLVPNADITLLPRIGHYPQVEDPVAVAEAFRSFRMSLAATG